MSSETLHRVLEAVEAMNLPEGEYLSTTNALKKAFESMPNDNDLYSHSKITEPITFIMESEVEFTILEGYSKLYNTGKNIHNYKVSIKSNNSVREKIYKEDITDIIIHLLKLLDCINLEVVVGNLTFKKKLEGSSSTSHIAFEFVRDVLYLVTEV